MPDSRFFTISKPITVKDIIDFLDIRLSGQVDADKISCLVSGIQTLNKAASKELSFFHNSKYLKDLISTKACCVLVEEKFVKFVPQNTIALVTTSPYRSYAQIASKLHTQRNDYFIENFSKDFSDKITLGSGVFIGKNVQIGIGTIIGANTCIAQGVIIGKNCHIEAGVKISHAIIGDNVIIAPGVCVGQSGFGFSMDKQGYIPVPQLGKVLIEDKVNIGANVTIDRGTIEDTVVGQGTQIDNLVQIAHGVKIGKNCIIVAQAGIAGSSIIGNNVIIAGQSAIAGHIKIGDNTQIAGKSGVFRNIENNSKVAGFPAVPIRQWHRQNIMLAKLSKEKTKNYKSE